jgi:uncharacterized protein (DUF2062 family)
MRPSTETVDIIKQRAALFLRQGMSPRRLACTLAIGFVLGFIPVLGAPTAICAMIALAFRLNQPAIQAANYAAMPFQLALIVPFVRLGARLMPSVGRPPVDLAALSRSPFQLLSHSTPQALIAQIGVLTGQALLAWILVAIPVAALLAGTLTIVLRRIPALAAIRSGR